MQSILTVGKQIKPNLITQSIIVKAYEYQTQNERDIACITPPSWFLKSHLQTNTGMPQYLLGFQFQTITTPGILGVAF